MPQRRVSSAALAVLLSLCLAGIVLAPAAVRAEEGPYLLADIARGPVAPSTVSLSEEPSGFFQLGDRLLFSTADPDSLDQAILWSTDGTARGTVQLSTTLCVSTGCRASLPWPPGAASSSCGSSDGPDRTDIENLSRPHGRHRRREPSC